MPKRKTQNKRAGKKQRRRTAMRQRGGVVIYTLTIEKNINNGQINIHKGTDLKELIDGNISSPENYMFKKGTQNHYSAYAINYIPQPFDQFGPTINTWKQMGDNRYNSRQTYAEEYRRKGYMPYDEIIKQ